MSVRGERVVYRERDRESERVREDAPKKTYTTIKRYQVPESTTKTRRAWEEEDVSEDKIIIRRERREESTPRDEVEYKVTERVREREREPRREEEDFYFSERVTEREREPRRDIKYRVIERESDHGRGQSSSRSEFRVVERERDRETVRAPSPPTPERVREWRFERERDFSPPERERAERPYDVERYSKSTEYFAQPQPAPQPIIIRESAPQPIIIREERREPQRIIIREERREPQYEFIEREEVKEETKSLVKREETPEPEPEPELPVAIPAAASVVSKKPEEDYFYERRIIERRRRDESQDRRTEIRPRDSASQYSSDDSYEYVRRERTYEGDRDHSPHHKRHLAEGALAGIAAGEIIRHHKRSQGERPPGQARTLVGGAALGAVGAEALSRVRSMNFRSRSRSRSISRDGKRDRRDRRKHRSRSRSRSRAKSLSRAQTLGGIAAVAAVGALAGYALKKGGNKETVVVNDRPHRRSRSRRRRASVDAYSEDGRSTQATSPQHRNQRIAQAGLASAAAAGIWEKVRSRSRGAKGKRSKSRLRQGVPIAAAGLGGAALAGLYEKNKANKQATKEAIVTDELNRGRRRHSRSRSRSVPADDRNRRHVDDRGLIAYGNEPIYPDSQRGYNSDEEPGMYRRRHQGASNSGSSPDTRRSRSRGRDFAEAGAVAGGAGLATHEWDRRNRSRSRGEDGYRQDAFGRDNESAYGAPPGEQPSGYLPPHQQAAGYNQAQAYPSSHYFPPPPTGDYARDPQAEAQNPIPAYNPADYAPGATQHPAPNQPYGAYGASDPNLGAPYPNDTFAGDQRYTSPGAVPHEERRGGRDPENVSAPTGSPHRGEPHDADGVRTPRARSSSRVRFDLGSNTEHSPETARKARHHKGHGGGGDDDEADDGGRRHRRHRKKHRVRDDGGGHQDSPDLMHDHYERSPNGSDSDGTEDLPARFDEEGNRRPESTGNALADKINSLIGGGGGGGFENLLKNLTGGGNDSHDNNGRSGRRRHRR